MAAIREMSTPGATVTWYVWWPMMASRALNSLRSMRATVAPLAWSTMSADVSSQLPFMASVTAVPRDVVNVALALEPMTG